MFFKRSVVVAITVIHSRLSWREQSLICVHVCVIFVVGVVSTLCGFCGGSCFNSVWFLWWELFQLCEVFVVGLVFILSFLASLRKRRGKRATSSSCGNYCGRCWKARLFTSSRIPSFTIRICSLSLSTIIRLLGEHITNTSISMRLEIIQIG